MHLKWKSEHVLLHNTCQWLLSSVKAKFLPWLPRPSRALQGEEASPTLPSPTFSSAVSATASCTCCGLYLVYRAPETCTATSVPPAMAQSISPKSSLNSLKTNWQSFLPSSCFISSIGPVTHYLLSVLLGWDVSPVTAGTFSSLLYSWHLIVPGTS